MHTWGASVLVVMSKRCCYRSVLIEVCCWASQGFSSKKRDWPRLCNLLMSLERMITLSCGCWKAAWNMCSCYPDGPEHIREPVSYTLLLIRCGDTQLKWIQVVSEAGVDLCFSKHFIMMYVCATGQRPLTQITMLFLGTCTIDAPLMEIRTLDCRSVWLKMSLNILASWSSKSLELSQVHNLGWTHCVDSPSLRTLTSASDEDHRVVKAVRACSKRA